jgi:hypothetical protein
MIKSRKMRRAGHVARMEEMRCAYKFLIGNPEKKHLGRPGSWWADYIKMLLNEIVFEGLDWVHLVLDRDPWLALTSSAMNLRIP